MGHRDEGVATSNPPGVALGDKYDKAEGMALLADWPAECLELAQLPARIRGYGHVKDKTIGPARERMQELVLQITGEAMDLSGTSTSLGYGKYLNHLWT